MGNHNSLDFYKSLTLRLHRDITEMLSTKDSVGSLLDAREIARRVDAEGISFLTKTLPAFGKAVDKALQGTEPLYVPGFKKESGSELPLFMGTILQRIFDHDGLPLIKGDSIVGDTEDTSFLSDDHPNYRPLDGCYRAAKLDIAKSLKLLRTLTYFNYKLEIPYEKKTEDSVINSFIRTEEELSNQEFPPESEPLLQEAEHFMLNCLYGVPLSTDSIPRHGPGAVATGERGGEKSNFSRTYKANDFEWIFPKRRFFGLNADHLKQQLAQMDVLTGGTAKVVLVPKDSRGPRLISCEPLEFQWLQQGLATQIVEHVEHHPLTRGHVNFTCQDINRELAMLGSSLYKQFRPTVIKYREVRTNEQGGTVSRAVKRDVVTDDWVTLDMKDASDRVSLKLVVRLMRELHFFTAMMACRSDATILPDGRQVALKKFAPMGSALCFPVEAMIFYALAVAAVHRHTSYSWLQCVARVYVYGDDIICDREVYPIIMRHLSRVGLVFNEQKCCVSGFFRESCGCDAYLGIDVTPIRLRKTWCHDGGLSAEELVSYVSQSNALYAAGFVRAAEYIKCKVEARYGPLPYVQYEIDIHTDIPSQQNKYRTSRVIGFKRHEVDQHRNFYSYEKKNVRWNIHLQRREVKGWVVTPVLQNYGVHGWNELFRTLVCGSTGLKPGVYAVPHRSRLKRGWGAH